MSEISTRRPGGVTFVVAITWLIAFLDMVAGALLLLLSFSKERIADAGLTASDVRAYGIMILLIGLLTAVVAVGLAAGSNPARVGVILIMVLRIAAGVWALVAIRDITTWSALVEIVFSLIVIGLLTTRRASDFFRGR